MKNDLIVNDFPVNSESGKEGLIIYKLVFSL